MVSHAPSEGIKQTLQLNTGHTSHAIYHIPNAGHQVVDAQVKIKKAAAAYIASTTVQTHHLSGIIAKRHFLWQRLQSV